jgi:hypothetical protein
MRPTVRLVIHTDLDELLREDHGKAANALDRKTDRAQPRTP